MTYTHYTDAGHPGTSSEASSDTIEMTNLEDHSQAHKLEDDKELEDGYQGDFEGSDDEDDVDRALLGLREQPPEAGLHASSTVPQANTWRQVLRIVIEVRSLLLLSAYCSDIWSY